SRLQCSVARNCACGVFPGVSSPPRDGGGRTGGCCLIRSPIGREAPPRGPRTQDHPHLALGTHVVEQAFDRLPCRPRYPSPSLRASTTARPSPAHGPVPDTSPA